jgi:hypothetical protein
MGEEQLYPLGLIKSFDLSDRKALTTFLINYFTRTIPGFVLLEADTEWEECSADLFGKDGAGRPIAIFPTVLREERTFFEITARVLHTASWFEEHKRLLRQVYDKQGLNWNTRLKIILVVPALYGRSCAVSERLWRSGVEVMEYSCYRLESYDGRGIVMQGISLEAKGEQVRSSVPVMPTSRRERWPGPGPLRTEVEAAALEVESPVSEVVASKQERWSEPVSLRAEVESLVSEVESSIIEAESSVPEVTAAPEAPIEPSPSETLSEPPERAPSVEAFIASLADENLREIATRLFSFFRLLLPGAKGVMDPTGYGFTVTLERERVAGIYLDQGFLWLEMGQERIPTGRIADLGVLEKKVMKRLDLFLLNRQGRSKVGIL